MKCCSVICAEIRGNSYFLCIYAIECFFLKIITSNLSYPEIKQVRKIRSGALFLFFFFRGSVLSKVLCSEVRRAGHAYRALCAVLSGRCGLRIPRCSGRGCGWEDKPAKGSRPSWLVASSGGSRCRNLLFLN